MVGIYFDQILIFVESSICIEKYFMLLKSLRKQYFL